MQNNWEMTLCESNGVRILTSIPITSINENSSLQDIENVEKEIIERGKKGFKTFIKFYSMYPVNDEFIEHMENVIMPMQNVEKVKFYFQAFIGSMAHHGIKKDDLPEEENQ